MRVGADVYRDRAVACDPTDYPPLADIGKFRRSTRTPDKGRIPGTAQVRYAVGLRMLQPGGKCSGALELPGRQNAGAFRGRSLKGNLDATGRNSHALDPLCPHSVRRQWSRRRAEL